MKLKKIRRFILLIGIVIIGSLGAGTLMSINKEIQIEDLEVLVDNAENGDIYLMLVNENDSQILRVNSEGEIIDRNISRSSSLFSEYVTEYEGCVLEEGDKYLYCVKRWTDPNTMEVVRRDIVRLDIDNFSEKPEVLHSYENFESELPKVTGIVGNNNIIYVALMDSKGEKAYVDKISYLNQEEGFEAQRIMSLSSPDSDKFSDVLFSLQGNMVSLMKSGRIYLYDQRYNEKLIYPESIDNNEYASLISFNKFNGNVSLYNPEIKEMLYYNGELKHLMGKKEGKNDNQKNSKFEDEVFFNDDYIPLYFTYDKEYNANTILMTTQDPTNDKCKIVKSIGENNVKVFDTIKFSNKVIMHEILLKSLNIFYVLIIVLLGIYFIFYVIKRGHKVVYKFILVIIPILSIGFTVLCYFQINYGKRVVYDLKVANAMTVNHSTINNIDSGLVRKLRDNREAYWDGTYQTLYDMIQISSRIGFDDISDEIFDKYKIAGTDSDYIYNEIFLVKDDKLYTGVSGTTGYMFPMGTQYFNGTENLFETLRMTGVPQNGMMMSKTRRGGVYITPIIDNNELVGILSTFYDIYPIDQFVKNNIKKAFIICPSILIAALVLIIVMFSIILRPLRELEGAVKQIAEGKYTVKLIDTGNDEFSRIRMIFNKMSDKLNSSIYRINNVSKSYFRFVPRHMFAILEKKDILDVKLGDKMNIDCILVTHSLYNFDDIEKKIIDNRGDNLSSVIGFVDRYFNIVYDNLKNREGSLLSSELNLGKMEYIFLNSERQAVECAIDIIKKLSTEVELNQFEKINTSLIIYKSNMLYGIVGKEKRSLPFIASIDKDEMDDVLYNFKFSGAKVIITEEIKESLENWPELNIRYIGYSYTNNQNKRISMYEVLDCCDMIERQQKESTISMFQKALNLFYNKEFYLARNEFSNVVRKSPLDNIARWYLFLSEKYINDKEKKNYNLALYGDKDVEIKDIGI